MDGVRVGLLGADRSDGIDTVLVSAAENMNRLVRFSRNYGIAGNREGKCAFEVHLKRGPFKTSLKDIRVGAQ